MALYWMSNGPTPESIRSALETQQRERAEVTQKTGVTFTTDGRPVLVPCGLAGCRFEASAKSEGRALRLWANHRVRTHWRKAQ